LQLIELNEAIEMYKSTLATNGVQILMEVRTCRGERSELGGDRTIGRRERGSPDSNSIRVANLFLLVRNVWEVNVSRQTFKCELEFNLRWEITYMSDFRFDKLGERDNEWVPAHHPTIEIVAQVGARTGAST